MFDRNQNRYVPTIAGLGMHVEVRDPLDSIIMSRVRHRLLKMQYPLLFVINDEKKTKKKPLH